MHYCYSPALHCTHSISVTDFLNTGFKILRIIGDFVVLYTTVLRNTVLHCTCSIAVTDFMNTDFEITCVCQCCGPWHTLLFQSRLASVTLHNPPYFRFNNDSWVKHAYMKHCCFM